MTISALRVAVRFAARAMKPEKLRAILLKLRKGAGFGMMKELMPVLQALGGWRFDEILYPKPDVWFRDDNKSSFWSKDRAEVEAEWRQVKDREVQKLPVDAQLGASDLHKKLTTDVTPIETKGDAHRFEYRGWTISRGVRTTAPNGATFDAGFSPIEFEREYASHLRDLTTRVRFMDWLKNDTPFFKQVNETLGTDPIEHELEQKRLEKQRKHRAGGNATCPACFGQFKLTKTPTKYGKDKTMPGMVLHGYKRPGTGWIEGNCFGQDWPPFELSPEGTEAWVERMEGFVPGRENWLRKLRANEVTEFSDMGYDSTTRTITNKLFKKEEVPPYEWKRRYERELKDAEVKLDSLLREIARLHKLIADWKPEPLPL